MLNEQASMYEFVEESDDNEAKRFYDYCWDKHRSAMRALIESYCLNDGNERYKAWVESFNTLQDEVMGDR